MFGCMFKALGMCSFRKGLLAKSLGPIFGTYQPQGMVSMFKYILLYHPAAPGTHSNKYTAVTAGDQSLETAQRETNEELGIDVPVEVGKQHACVTRLCICCTTIGLSVMPHWATTCIIMLGCCTPPHYGHCHSSPLLFVPCIAPYAVEYTASLQKQSLI